MPAQLSPQTLVQGRSHDSHREGGRVHEHQLVGLVTHDLLLRLFAEGPSEEEIAEMLVSEVMLTDIVSIPPDTLTTDALRIMQEERLPCLPVVEKGKLVGLLTEQDIMELARNLLEDKFS